MNIQRTAAELRAYGNRILSAADALEGGPGKKRPGRVISAQGRARIADAQRKRWAKARKAAKAA